ncbi:MAG: ATP synthase F1 subunit delta [Deltaproteobacteria bacterium]|nr:ATP synthase F1 subunit delta [Deltaproteobacteria bacterium]
MAKRAGKLSRRYARALLTVAEKQLGAEQLQPLAAKLATFGEEFERNRELQAALMNPMFPVQSRISALREMARLFQLGDLLERSLDLLFERDRLQILPEISQAFTDLTNERAKIIDVEVQVAKDLDSGERNRTEEMLRKTIKGSPRFAWRVTPEILGGMIVRYGGKVVDGSIHGRLNRLERELGRS